MARPRRPVVIRIEFDEVIQDNCPLSRIALFFKEGGCDGEEYNIQVIKKHLRTPAQKQMLFDLDLTIEDCLNGRYGQKEEKQVQAMYDDWNKKLGHRQFGF